MTPSQPQVIMPTLPTAPANPPMIQANTATKPSPKSTTPTFLNQGGPNSASPFKNQLGTKQLVGQ